MCFCFIPKQLEWPHPELVHQRLLVHSSPNQESLQKPNSNISKQLLSKTIFKYDSYRRRVNIRAFLNLWQQWDVTGVERSGMKLCLRSNQ
jgi:hypothetical protein